MNVNSTISEVKQYLLSLRDDKKAIFDKHLITSTNVVFLGIKSDVLKKYAKDIINNKQTDEVLMIINKLPIHEYYEIDMLKALLIDYIKLPINDKIKLWDDISYTINNWAVCDQMVCNTKVKKDDLGILWEFCKSLLVNSEYPFRVRVGLVFILKYFIKKEYLLTVFNVIDTVDQNNYFVAMGLAWLLSVALVVDFNVTSNYILTSNNLNYFVYQKAWQKGLDSYRITDENKILIRQYKKLREANNEF